MLLGPALSGSGLSFISATAEHKDGISTGIVVCETQEQCDAVDIWAEREGWDVVTRVGSDEEVAQGWAIRIIDEAVRS